MQQSNKKDRDTFFAYTVIPCVNILLPREYDTQFADYTLKFILMYCLFIMIQNSVEFVIRKTSNIKIDYINHNYYIQDSNNESNIIHIKMFSANA